MDTKDLMIGDWVYLCGVPCRVKDIVDDGVINYEKDVAPIPLTKETLYKNGFKHDGFLEKTIIDMISGSATNSLVVLVSEDNRIILNNADGYINSFNKWYIHIDTEDMRRMCTAEITYVHELQHLLKLCKIDKEIYYELD